MAGLGAEARAAGCAQMYDAGCDGGSAGSADGIGAGGAAPPP
jgi:hypothetical protein